MAKSLTRAGVTCRSRCDIKPITMPGPRISYPCLSFPNILSFVLFLFTRPSHLKNIFLHTLLDFHANLSVLHLFIPRLSYIHPTRIPPCILQYRARTFFLLVRFFTPLYFYANFSLLHSNSSFVLPFTFTLSSPASILSLS